MDWEALRNFFALTSLSTMESSTAHTVPTKRNRMLMTSVLRVTVHAQLDLKKYSKFLRPTNGLIMPVL